MLRVSRLFQRDVYKRQAQCIPRLLTDEHKNLRPALSLQHFMCYQQQGNAFLHQIVAVMSLGAVSYTHLICNNFLYIICK